MAPTRMEEETMDKVTQDNPQAFPRALAAGIGCSGWGKGDPGMTLRDWFAGQATAQAMAQHTLNCQDRGTLPDWTDAGEREQVAGIAYLMADAMLAARQK